MNHAYLGVEYEDEDVHDAMDKWLVRLETTTTPSKDICAETAKALSEGHVVGWFQGRSEFGPRALGNRSILADPRKAEMKDILNKRVKFRQAFRPFAPIVLAERSSEIFEGDEDPRLCCLPSGSVRNGETKSRQSFTSRHRTGATVRQETNERLYRLLKEFDAITGVPVLLNTSFNVKGEPIVETPRDALHCFLTTGIDYLALHDKLIAKTALHRVLAPIERVFSDVGMIVRNSMQAD